MEYRYGKNENYEDFSSGRVLYNAGGVPNFPVRLAQEIYGRCLEYLNKTGEICLYDCCCGGGYLLTVLGFLNQDTIAEIIGTDIDEKAVDIAIRNVSLLTPEGMDKRIAQIRGMISQFGKPSHREAEDSALKLKKMIKREIKTTIFQADALKPIKLHKTPDIIITDLPYGNLVSWGDNKSGPDKLLASLYEVCGKHTVVGICMDKKQKAEYKGFVRLEKQTVGKRKFELLKKV